jgi:hypothetical protein
MITPERMVEILTLLLPVKGPLVSLELACFDGAKADEHEGSVRIALRLIVSDLDESGASRIRDVKEQLVSFLPKRRRDESDARIAAYAEGWCDALKEVFASKEDITIVETLMPHDLVASKVLDLARVNTREAFREALLAKSHLGALVRGVPDPDPNDESVF